MDQDFIIEVDVQMIVDFATLDELAVIPYTQFFSFEDEDKFIYVFDILSIYNLYIKNKTQVQNPFSTN